MTAAPLAFPFFSIRFGRRTRPAQTSYDDAIARRDFINTMIDENPRAFTSEHDVYQVMCHLPGKF